MTGDETVAAEITELMALGQAFLDSGKLAEAQELFAGLQAIVPDHIQVNRQLGVVLATRGAFAAAIAPLLQAATLDPTDPVVFNVLAACAFETGDPASALGCADQALALRPAYPEAHNNRANALLRLGRAQESAQAFQAALAFTPRDAELHLNHGNALEALGQLPAALASVERAIALQPGLVAAHVNRGNILQKLARHREALDAYGQALALDPRSVDANWNRAVCQLLLGDFEDGWAGYEWRWRTPRRVAEARDLGRPLWLGQESLQGRTLLVHGEQGLGDTLQFIRYLPRVAALGARIVLEVFAPLAGLLDGLPDVAQVIRRGDPIPPFDLQVPLLSLPLARGLFEPLSSPPYLAADPARAAAWAERLGPRIGPRIGLVCSGSPTHGGDARRSIPFETLAPWLPEGPQYHLLQKELREADQTALAAHPDVAVWADQLVDFRDTAALCAQMDLVVSVDTSVAHLAGALGTPVWVLIPIDPDWRWGLGSETTPWYPQMRLYRQARRDDWGDALQRIARDLAALA